MAELSAILADASFFPLGWVSTLSGAFASSLAFSFESNLLELPMGPHSLEVGFHELLGVCFREVVGLQVRNIFLTWDLEVILSILVFPGFLLLFLVTGTVF